MSDLFKLLKLSSAHGYQHLSNECPVCMDISILIKKCEQREKLQELVKAKLRDYTEFVEKKLGSDKNQLHNMILKHEYQYLVEESEK